MENIVVIGAGVMGSAVAIHLGNNGHKVNLWGTEWDSEIIDKMKETKEHEGLGAKVPDTISFYYHDQLEEAIKDTKLIIIAVISKGMESMSNAIAPYVTENNIILSVTKGLDEKTNTTMSTVIENALPEELKDKVDIVKLGGPIIAAELAKGNFTEGVFACENIESAKYAQEKFRSPRFKAGVSEDTFGVDLCAAFKNCYAIAMGMVEGIEGNSNNPKAALMARGAIEMANIVEAYGGSRETALGIAGVGDYYVTAQGGRNGKFGSLLGDGNTKDEALEIMENQTVEGIFVTLNGHQFLKKLEEEGKINMEKDTPLFMEIYKVLYENKPVKEAIDSYWISE